MPLPATLLALLLLLLLCIAAVDDVASARLQKALDAASAPMRASPPPLLLLLPPLQLVSHADRLNHRKSRHSSSKGRAANIVFAVGDHTGKTLLLDLYERTCRGLVVVCYE
jgi:hypothetical protein